MIRFFKHEFPMVICTLLLLTAANAKICYDKGKVPLDIQRVLHSGYRKYTLNYYSIVIFIVQIFFALLLSFKFQPLAANQSLFSLLTLI